MSNDIEAAIRRLHASDHHRAEDLIDWLVTLPLKREAILAVVQLLEQARVEGTQWPDITKEMRRRRVARAREGPKPKEAV